MVRPMIAYDINVINSFIGRMDHGEFISSSEITKAKFIAEFSGYLASGGIQVDVDDGTPDPNAPTEPENASSPMGEEVSSEVVYENDGDSSDQAAEDQVVNGGKVKHFHAEAELG